MLKNTEKICKGNFNVLKNVTTLKFLRLFNNSIIDNIFKHFTLIWLHHSCYPSKVWKFIKIFEKTVTSRLKKINKTLHRSYTTVKRIKVQHREIMACGSKKQGFDFLFMCYEAKYRIFIRKENYTNSVKVSTFLYKSSNI